VGADACGFGCFLGAELEQRCEEGKVVIGELRLADDLVADDPVALTDDVDGLGGFPPGEAPR
jgi:hypothetical protein